MAENPAAAPRDPGKLHGFVRLVLALLGVAGLVSGTVGVFVVNRDFGPIALLVIGALLLLVGGFGWLPRLKWNDKEVDFTAAARVGNIVADHAENLPQSEVDGLINELSNVSPAVSEPVLRAMRNQELMLNGLRASLPEGVTSFWEEDVLEAFPLLGDRRRVDGLLVKNGKRVLVEARPSGELPVLLWDTVKKMGVIDDSLVGGLLLAPRVTPSNRERYEALGWTVSVVDPLNIDTAALKTDVWRAFNPNYDRLPAQ